VPKNTTNAPYRQKCKTGKNAQGEQMLKHRYWCFNLGHYMYNMKSFILYSVANKKNLK
jgi:hypothetical protein